MASIVKFTLCSILYSIYFSAYVYSDGMFLLESLTYIKNNIELDKQEKANTQE